MLTFFSSRKNEKTINSNDTLTNKAVTNSNETNAKEKIPIYKPKLTPENLEKILAKTRKGNPSLKKIPNNQKQSVKIIERTDTTIHYELTQPETDRLSDRITSCSPVTLIDQQSSKSYSERHTTYPQKRCSQSCRTALDGMELCDVREIFSRSVQEKDDIYNQLLLETMKDTTKLREKLERLLSMIEEMDVLNRDLLVTMSVFLIIEIEKVDANIDARIADFLVAMAMS